MNEVKINEKIDKISSVQLIFRWATIEHVWIMLDSTIYVCTHSSHVAIMRLTYKTTQLNQASN